MDRSTASTALTPPGKILVTLESVTQAIGGTQSRRGSCNKLAFPPPHRRGGEYIRDEGRVNFAALKVSLIHVAQIVEDFIGVLIPG